MFRLEVEDISKLIQAAQGMIENDILIRGCKVFNVFTKQFVSADVYIFDKFISHVEWDITKQLLPTRRIIYEENKILVPGFIDTHTHIESSLLSPERYAELVLPHGTTTVVEDAHEIANVLGLEGIEYMLNVAIHLPMRQLMSLPSCVPSVLGLENSNGEIYANQYRNLLDHDYVIGLGEIMDYEGVLSSEKRVLDMISLATTHDAYLQGHAPQVMGNRLSAYLCTGIASCHESKQEVEILDKYQKGMWIDIRNANTGNHFETSIQVLNKHKLYDRVSFCSDDRRCNVTSKDGHLNYMIKKAVSLHMPLEEALLCTTLHPAQELGLSRMGAIAPGYIADMNILNNMQDLKVEKVLYEGKVVFEEKQLISIPYSTFSKVLQSKNTIHLHKNFDISKLHIKVNKSKIKMKYVSYESFYSSTTFLKKKEFDSKDGFVSLDNESNMMFIAVINRYGKNAHTVCVVENFGINQGALASSVGHDCHNITVVYDTVENGWMALKEIEKMQGGFCAVENGKLIAQLPLPIAGLMSDKSILCLNKELENMVEANRTLGNIYLENPISRITIANLLVCPYVKISDMGLVLTEEKKIVSIMEEE